MRTTRASVTIGVTAVLGAAAALFLGWLTGLTPGDTLLVTIDHCYRIYDMQEAEHSRCVGHWTRLGTHVGGPVFGVDTSQWRPLSPPGGSDFEVVIPANQRRTMAIADDQEATAIPLAWLLALGAIILLLLLVKLLRIKRGPPKSAQWSTD